MPHYIWRLGRVVVNVNIRFSDTNSRKPNRQTRLYYFQPVCACIASNVNAAPVRMCARSRPAAFLFPRRGTVCGIEYKRNPGQFAGRIQFVHCVLFHIL